MPRYTPRWFNKKNRRWRADGDYVVKRDTTRAVADAADANLGDARAAIDQYFEERNAYFSKNPRRAGNKIWGKEREPAVFSEAGNFKDPRYR